MMMGNILPEQNLEKQIGKQMGCMAGFLQIFDRHQILSGKRLYSTKRLPPTSTPPSETTTEEEKAVGSPAKSRELDKQPQVRVAASPDRSKQSPVRERTTPTGNQSKSSLPLTIFECKEGSARSPWKFKEAPRLSLDSRAVVDAKGSLKPREIRTNASIFSTNRCESNRVEYEADDNYKQLRSPSVIARLMGLEPFPDSNTEPNRKLELRRCASEARGVLSNVVRENGAKQDRFNLNRSESLSNARAEPVQAPVRGMDREKCFYDSADFFPERKQTTSIYGGIEKRLKMSGIDEPSKDLETLKQILEACSSKAFYTLRNLESKRITGTLFINMNNLQLSLSNREDNRLQPSEELAKIRLLQVIGQDQDLAGT
ncbi:CRC domain-containing protein TSO1-like [Hibiscus syriacus]|uniref:CRC domain-containing protein TSO1-like n=1 Tax=Hibiscus syriacus TaxID=106335 RepID=A0A6A2ZLP2_HIBSY|nr:CRC domain-containing protein TSO1-like [Hibiscus syriacus]